MISAVLGMIIASCATTSLLITIIITNKAIKSQGRMPLTNSEKQTILNAGYSENDLENINIDIQNIKLLD
tara:strand:- start:171 stop:380 length:210 start_codon:yes stop_codon:yes gene_type:complete